MNIDYSNEAVINITALHNGTKHLIEANHVISTVSLGILKSNHESLFTPKLPPSLVEAISEISFGATDHIKLDFEEPFWDMNNPGIMILWSNEVDYSSKPETEEINRSNWFKSIYGYDESLHHPTTLMGWIYGRAARYMETLSDSEIAEDLCSKLQSIISKYKQDPSWTLPKLKQIIVSRWYSNPNFKGVYSYRNHSSDLKGITNKDLSHPIYVNGCPRILFAGEATDSDHYGTVHGAMCAGAREVDRLEAFWKNNP